MRSFLRHNQGAIGLLVIFGAFFYAIYLASPNGKSLVAVHQPSGTPILQSIAAPSSPQPAQQASSTESGEMSVFGNPTVNANFINSLLCKAGSPACGTGQLLYDAAIAKRIDPAIPLAFFWHESGFGLAGMARITNSLGNLRCIDGAGCVNTAGGACLAGESCYASFPDWKTGAGYEAWCNLIAGPVYAGSGRTTVDAIIPKYAPTGDKNNVHAYINSVKYAVALWRSGKEVLP